MLKFYKYQSLVFYFALICLSNIECFFWNKNPESATTVTSEIEAKCPRPLHFPWSIQLIQETYQNWANDIIVEGMWSAVPKTPGEVVLIANWAAAHGYKVRASGYQHNWSPLTVTSTASCRHVLLVRTTTYLTKMEMIIHHSKPALKAQTGVSMEALLTFAEKNGYGVLASTAPGQVTIGGVLATGGHGTGIRAEGEKSTPGFTYGSLSNLITSFTAVVWDSVVQKFVLKTFDRSDKEAKAFLVHVGRAFLTEVTLRVGLNYNLRCVSKTYISSDELFSPPVNSPELRTFDNFLKSDGRVEAILYPFTGNPWLKVWTVTIGKPHLSSLAVSTPFNYPFSDNIDVNVALIAGNIVSSNWHLAPTLGSAEYAITVAGLLSTASYDIWGPSKNLLMYIKPTTLRVTANGFAVITTRSSIQIILHIVTTFYQNLLEEYQNRGEYPINGPLEIRVTGLDHPEDVGVPGAEAPAFSPLRPVKGHPELNCAVWFDFHYFPRTPLANNFLMDMESYFLTYVHNGKTAVVRPEWSKGWAFTPNGPWTNQSFWKERLPSLYDEWDWTVSTLDKYDPAKVFSNEFLDQVFV